MKNKERKLSLSREYRCFLYFIFVTVVGIMNVSSGLLSSASNEIKKQIKMSEAEFGSFSLSLSIGRVIGSLLFSFLNKLISRKWLMIVSMIIRSTSLSGFYFLDNKYLLIILRGVQGFSQMPPSIYTPIWINQFGLKEYKTIQMTSIQLFATLGVFLGYLINLIIGKENWQIGFVIESLYLIFCVLCLIISNNDYFSNNLFSTEESLDKTIFEENVEDEKKKSNYCEDLRKLIVNHFFMICILCRVILQGLNTCLRYWLADFLRNAVGEKNDLKITICTLFITFTGPLAGLIANASLRKKIGSYESKKSSWPLVFLQICASFTAIGIGFMPNTISVTCCTIAFFFFNSSALPLLQGILINCVDKDLTATGFSLASLLTQILTSGSVTTLYGKINDIFLERNKRIAMIVCMSFHFVAVPLLIILAILRNKNIDDGDKKKEEEQELMEQKENENP